MKKLIKEKVTFDENGQWLVKKFDDGSISSEPLTSEEASKWEAENKF